MRATPHVVLTGRKGISLCYAIAVGSKTPADLSYYSELFNVGVIEVRFSTEAYKTFIDDGTVDPDYVEVREIFNAPRVPPPEELKHSFMRGVEIDKKKSLYTQSHRRPEI